MAEESPIDEVVESVRAALHDHRGRLLSHVARVQSALDAYRRAAEHAIALSFARDHNLQKPRASGNAIRAAEELLSAVLALPELAKHSANTKDVSPQAAPQEVSVPAPQSSPPPSPPAQATDSWTLLLHASDTKPIVIVGGSFKLDKLAWLPAALAEHVEWVDTNRQGTRAIGNLGQRIKGGRIAALIVVEGRVGHKHSEPLLSAAREAGIPSAFAGKGGGLALKQAFEYLSESLRRARPNASEE